MIAPRIAAACALTAGAIIAAAGCGSSTSTTASGVTRTQTVTVTTTGTTGTATPATSAQNLPVSDALRQQLLIAGARATALPASDFAGLVPGRTYYAYDPASSTYWAGAELAAARSAPSMCRPASPPCGAGGRAPVRLPADGAPGRHGRRPAAKAVPTDSGHVGRPDHRV